MKRTFITVVVIANLALFSAPRAAAVEETATGTFIPAPPEGKRFTLVWGDEFDGDKLDAAKWSVTEGPRRDGFWRADAVKLDGDGHLVISTFMDGDKYIDGVVDSSGKFEHTYGFYTARVRLQRSVGHWSAFWLMPRDICAKVKGGGDGTEIDIYEKIDQTDTVLHNLHWDCYCDIFCAAGTRAEVTGVMEGYHEFSLWWTPDEYVFYVDGRETWRTAAGGVCAVPLYVLFSDEIGTWAGDIREAELPDDFAVDYVRVYDLVEK